MESAAAALVVVSTGLINPSRTFPIKHSYANPFPSNSPKTSPFRHTLQANLISPSSSKTILGFLSTQISPKSLQYPVPISSILPCSRAFVSGEGQAASNPPPDAAVVLNVEGMICGGCTASVKRILESQPQVSSASVNLETASAVVLPTPEVIVTENWQQHLGEALANHLTNCGFKSSRQGRGKTTLSFMRCKGS